MRNTVHVANLAADCNIIVFPVPGQPNNSMFWTSFLLRNDLIIGIRTNCLSFDFHEYYSIESSD